jgi:ArsR family transcriptional regulator, arsenate/arsenite/antimonite-responsive transcriptional repressor
MNNARTDSTMQLRDFLAITKALADENRVRLLLALTSQELCLCQLVEMLGLAPSTVSKHMSILRQARLVEGRKQGRWQYFRLAGRTAAPAVRQAIAWTQRSAADDPRVIEDAKRLTEILRLDPLALCESQYARTRSGAAANRIVKRLYRNLPIRR